jgi:hypothetical protein
LSSLLDKKKDKKKIKKSLYFEFILLYWFHCLRTAATKKGNKMSLFTQLNEVSIRASEANEILEILESSDCESLDEALNMIHEIWSSHYAKEHELELQIEKITGK